MVNMKQELKEKVKIIEDTYEMSDVSNDDKMLYMIAQITISLSIIADKIGRRYP